ncbi:hypothetical protein FRC07_003578 [Ceratobasidium sp. 392]|nr:hypothetical protein FRC07_003578 [Ceratobasidium sp. 392]
MSNQAPAKKKQRVAPPKAPVQAVAGLSSAPTSHVSYTTTAPRTAPAPVSSSTKGASAAASPSTPTERPHQSSVAPAKFSSRATSTAPQEDPQDSDDESDEKSSDGSSEVKDGSDEEHGLNKEESDEEESDEEELGGESDLGEDANIKTEDHERKVHEMRSGFQSRSRRAAVKLQVKPTPRTPSPLVSKNESPVKFEKRATEERQSSAYEDGIVSTHLRVSLVALFGYKQARDAAHAEPLYDDQNEAIWFKPDTRIAVPHFNRTLEENLAAWGLQYDALLKDESRLKDMDPKEKELILSIPVKKFRDALPTGAWGLMVQAWKENRDGKGEEVRQNKNRNSRRGGRKKEKAKRHMGSIKRSGLPVDKYGWMGDYELQSSEHSDPGDKSHITIVTRECISPEVSKIADAFDVEHEAQKTRPGKPVYTRVDRVLTNQKLKMSKGQKVPLWATRPGWIERNPTLERLSRPFIDSELKTMPNTKKVARFVHDHEPEERVYISKNPAPTFKGSAPEFDPVLPVPVANPPAAAPDVQPAAQPIAQPAIQPNPAHVPGQPTFPYYPSYTQQLAHYGLDRYVAPAEQNDAYGLFSGNMAGYGLPLPDYMLGGNGFDAAPGAKVDLSHPFNIEDGSTFDAIMAHVQDATADNLAPQPDPTGNGTSNSTSANDPPIAKPADHTPVPSAEIAAPTGKPAQQRLSGRRRQATAKAAAMEEAAAEEKAAKEKAAPMETTAAEKASTSQEATTLKPKLSKKAKKKLAAIGKGAREVGNEKKLGKDDNRAPTPGPSRAPFSISEIQRIKFKKLPGE